MEEREGKGGGGEGGRVRERKSEEERVSEGMHHRILMSNTIRCVN